MPNVLNGSEQVVISKICVGICTILQNDRMLGSYFLFSQGLAFCLGFGVCFCEERRWWTRRMEVLVEMSTTREVSAGSCQVGAVVCRRKLKPGFT